MATKDKGTVAQDLRRFATFFKDLSDAADTLDNLQSLESGIAASKKAADDAAAQAAEAKAEATKAKKDVDAAKAKADKIIADANDQALAKLQEADQKAQAIVDGAVVEGAKTLSRAQAEADNVTAAIAGQVAQLTSTKISLEQDLAGLNHAVEAKRIEAADLETRLAKAQASIAKLLG
jgi:chromosome segregation ATPase